MSSPRKILHYVFVVEIVLAAIVLLGQIVFLFIAGDRLQTLFTLCLLLLLSACVFGSCCVYFFEDRHERSRETIVVSVFLLLAAVVGTAGFLPYQLHQIIEFYNGTQL